MSGKNKNINWEPDLRKSFDIANNIKDLNQQIKDNSDKRKIDGFNPNDFFNNSINPSTKK